MMTIPTGDSFPFGQDVSARTSIHINERRVLPATVFDVKNKNMSGLSSQTKFRRPSGVAILCNKFILLQQFILYTLLPVELLCLLE